MTAHVPIAVRAFAVRTQIPHRRRRRRDETSWPRFVLVLDTETTTDPTQRLLFGSYRFAEWSACGALETREEGVLYADDLPTSNSAAFSCLRDYVETHEAAVGEGVPRKLKFYSRSQFVEQVLWQAYQARALVVGFNLPFDLSRLAVDCGEARGRKRGGFSLVPWEWRDPRNGRTRPHPYRPRITIQHLDSKRAFIEFTRPAGRDSGSRVPAFAGRFLDLRTLSFALTGTPQSLESACTAFGVANPKSKPVQHGCVTPEYIDYNRGDVRASLELLETLRAEFDRHPIDMDPCRAYSPASIAKAYLQTMRVRPMGSELRGVPLEHVGFATSAFYGGRAEARIRRTVVPVVLTDFTSMYPTVCALMGFWSFLTASEVKVVDATDEVRSLLTSITLDQCFDPATWRGLIGFAQVMPEGEILPARAQFTGAEWTVGVNPLTSSAPLWYAIPDLLASALLTGKPPKVLQAFRLAPKGRQRGLKPVRLRGGVEVDPKRADFFRTVIEARHRIKRDRELSSEERERSQLFLKTLANAGSYGVFFEMNRNQAPSNDLIPLAVHGREGRFEFKSRAPEDPGILCFPPMGAAITAAARLMLAVLERCVTDAGGSYAFVDTDSMAIVSSKEARLISCAGGPHRLRDRSPAMKTLAWSEVAGIVARFEKLNPYDRSAVPGSILKVEEVNFEPTSREQRETSALVISAKRYALFAAGEDGNPEVVKYSEHGLGQYLNPIDPENPDRDWIRQAWEGFVRESLGGPEFSPPWIDVPAMMRTGITNPRILKLFSRANRGKGYADQIKPFSFLISATVDPTDFPPRETSGQGFHLIAPYSRDPAEWTRPQWTDLHSGKTFRIRTNRPSDRTGIRVRSFRDVLARFRVHPEAKSAGPNGEPCGFQTVGLLRRRETSALSISHIGKESNLLEEQEAGILFADPQLVYSDPAEWEMVRALLQDVRLRGIARAAEISERMLRAYRQGARVPSRKAARRIALALERLTRRPAHAAPMQQASCGRISRGVAR